MSLKQQILSILGRVPNGMPLTALRAELTVVMNGAPGDSDLEQALADLRGKKLITEGKHPVTDDRTFKAKG